MLMKRLDIWFMMPGLSPKLSQKPLVSGSNDGQELQSDTGNRFSCQTDNMDVCEEVTQPKICSRFSKHWGEADGETGRSRIQYIEVK